MTTPSPRPRRQAALAVVLALAAATSARGQGGGAGSTASTHPGSGGAAENESPPPGRVSGAASSGWARYYPFYITTVTPTGEVVSYIPPPFVGFGPRPVVIVPFPAPGSAFNPGPVAPAPPPGLIRPVRPAEVRKVRQANPTRAEQLVTLGDRMFRIDDWKRAEDRYKQAARVDPNSASPRVRLAQVAIVRERYREAADRFREAETAQPGWIATARDVQALYAEPADFAARVARIESHLQAHPTDRDAWLVLGAQWFLSGRARRAADVFRRLDDPHRRPDVALAAFLDATNQPRDVEKSPEPPAPPIGDPFRPPVDPTRP